MVRIIVVLQNVEFHTDRMSVVRGVSLAILAPPTSRFTVW